MSESDYMDICEQLSRDLAKAREEIERLAADRNLEKKWRKDAQDSVTDLVDCLRDCQEFAKDSFVTANEREFDRLREIEERTARIVEPCS